MSLPNAPLRIIHSAAPIRICDNGGWTDTWFAEYGKIFNIGVYPYVEAQIEIYPRDALERVVIFAENYGERYVRHLRTDWERHPLLEAAIESMGVPQDLAIQVSLFPKRPRRVHRHVGCRGGRVAWRARPFDAGAFDRASSRLSRAPD